MVTSPPFLDVVDYQTDNWLRCWFCGIEASAVPVTLARRVDDWKAFVASTLAELRRVLCPGGHVAFEVGEVKGGTLRLEDVVIPAGVSAGLEPVLVLVNAQVFTKTANCWGVANNQKGTNTNRVVVFRKRGLRSPRLADPPSSGIAGGRRSVGAVLAAGPESCAAGREQLAVRDCRPREQLCR